MGPEPGAGNRLVRSFSSGNHCERGAKERLARARKSFDPRDKIDVGASDDDDMFSGVHVRDCIEGTKIGGIYFSLISSAIEPMAV